VAVPPPGIDATDTHNDTISKFRKNFISKPIKLLWSIINDFVIFALTKSAKHSTVKVQGLRKMSKMGHGKDPCRVKQATRMESGTGNGPVRSGEAGEVEVKVKLERASGE
jgi:hypothetical protein